MFNDINKNCKGSEKALRILAMMADTSYIKQRDQKYCPKCDQAYESFLWEKYGINTTLIEPFFRFKRNKVILYDGITRVIDSRYIPSVFIERAKKKYDDYLANINKKQGLDWLAFNYMDYYQDKIKEMPFDYFETSPDCIDGRKKEISSKLLELMHSTEPFTMMFTNFKKFQCIINMFYEVTGTQNIQEPVRKEEVYVAGNKYYQLKIRGLDIQLEQPKYNRPNNRFIKPKSSVRFNAYMNLVKSKIINDREAIIKIVNGEKIPNDPDPIRLNRKAFIPEIEIPLRFHSITQIKNYIITLTRISIQNRKEDPRINQLVAIQNLALQGKYHFD